MQQTIDKLKRENVQLRGQQEESVRLLTLCSTQVGTIIGEQIAEHLSVIKGQRYNPAEWDMADRNGEQ